MKPIKTDHDRDPNETMHGLLLLLKITMFVLLALGGISMLATWGI